MELVSGKDYITKRHLKIKLFNLKKKFSRNNLSRCEVAVPFAQN